MYTTHRRGGRSVRRPMQGMSAQFRSPRECPGPRVQPQTEKPSEPTFRHGRTGYDKYKCKCDICRAANAERVRRNRARRLADPSRLTHGTVSAYDAGCRCEPCSDTRVIRYMAQEGGHRPHLWRETVTDIYRDSRDAWEAGRESGRPVFRVAGTAHSGCAAYQLSDAEYAEEFGPGPTFKAVLVEMAGTMAA